MRVPFFEQPFLRAFATADALPIIVNYLFCGSDTVANQYSRKNHKQVNRFS